MHCGARFGRKRTGNARCGDLVADVIVHASGESDAVNHVICGQDGNESSTDPVVETEHILYPPPPLGVSNGIVPPIHA